MKRIITSAKEVSEGFQVAFDALEDDIAYAMDGIEAVSRRNEAAAKNLLDQFNQSVQTIIRSIASELGQGQQEDTT